MTRRQLITVYSVIIFMMVWGFDLINIIKYNRDFSLGSLLNPFLLSQFIYVTVTLLLTRMIFLRYFPDRQYLKLFVSLAAVVAFFILLRYSLEEIAAPAVFNMSNYGPSVSPFYYILDNIYYAIIYLLLGFLVFLLDMQLSTQKKQAELIQQSREAELQFLRSQINPHFLFNTLNNIYSLVYEKSEKAPPAMLQLSDLMRYLLYEKKEMVPVSKEWSYIGNFITLQKLRFDYDIPLELSFEGEGNDKLIAPYLLIPFVENAFKHGDFRDPETPFIIRLVLTKTELLLEASNKTGIQNKDATGGVGLENVKRRLELLYPKKHELYAGSEGKIYKVRLLLKF